MRGIVPKYAPREANRQVLLRRAAVEISHGGATFRGRGTAFLQLLPRERVVVTARWQSLHGGPLTLATRPMAMRFGRDGRTIPALSVRLFHSSNGRLEMDLLPQGKFVNCRDRRARLSEAVFHVINFPEFFSQQARPGRRPKAFRPHVCLARAGLQIELQPLPQTHRLIRSLKQDGGSAITHVGRITRIGNKPFSIHSLEREIHHLHSFLSFARGLHTAIFGVVGANADGDTIYENWSISSSTPWASRFAWFDIHHGQTLEELYPGFVSLLTDANMGPAVARALYWYLRSNRAGDGAGVDGGLVLSQAALESLAHAYLTSSNLSTSGRAAEIIRRSFEELRLPIGIPQTMRSLRAGKRRNLWKDSPDAIVKVRNSLVHADNRLGNSLRPAISECWRMAQWYIELMLLRLAGYQGVYSDRLAPGWIGDVVNVPWNKKRQNLKK